MLTASKTRIFCIFRHPNNFATNNCLYVIHKEQDEFRYIFHNLMLRRVIRLVENTLNKHLNFVERSENKIWEKDLLIKYEWLGNAYKS